MGRLWPDSAGVLGKCLVPVGEPSVPLCVLTLSSFQTWDKELEALAQSYAEKCIWDHNKERGRRGENLFAMAPTLELEFAVEDWNGEEKFYNLTTSTCVPGQMCGHYTQVPTAGVEGWLLSRAGCQIFSDREMKSECSFTAWEGAEIVVAPECQSNMGMWDLGHTLWDEQVLGAAFKARGTGCHHPIP